MGDLKQQQKIETWPTTFILSNSTDNRLAVFWCKHPLLGAKYEICPLEPWHHAVIVTVWPWWNFLLRNITVRHNKWCKKTGHDFQWLPKNIWRIWSQGTGLQFQDVNTPGFLPVMARWNILRPKKSAIAISSVSTVTASTLCASRIWPWWDDVTENCRAEFFHQLQINPRKNPLNHQVSQQIISSKMAGGIGKSFKNHWKLRLFPAILDNPQEFREQLHFLFLPMDWVESFFCCVLYTTPNPRSGIESRMAGW
jgi:hypothetical protein